MILKQHVAEQLIAFARQLSAGLDDVPAYEARHELAQVAVNALSRAGELVPEREPPPPTPRAPKPKPAPAAPPAE